MWRAGVKGGVAATRAATEFINARSARWVGLVYQRNQDAPTSEQLTQLALTFCDCIRPHHLGGGMG